MNVDRGFFTVRTPSTGAGESHASPTTKADAQPAFELNLDPSRVSHHAPSRPHEPGAVRATLRDAARHDPAPRDATERATVRDDSERSETHNGSADASAERAPARSRDAGRGRSAHAHETSREHGAAASDASEAATSDDAASSPVDTARGDASRDDATADAALPDRMLALLDAPWRAMPAATQASGAPSPAATATAVLPGLADPTAATGLAPAAAAPAPGSLAVAMPGAQPITAASAPSVDALAAASTADAGADTLVALAALADPKATRAASATPGTDPTSATAGVFAPVLTRAIDATQAAVRAVAVDPSSAGPLALDAGFDDGLSSRVLWMADQRVDRAEIRVTPEGLGPIDVRLQMDGHRVHAQFNASHADVRHALESGMDRLRDMLGRQGMELGQAQVGTGQRQSGDGRSPGAPPSQAGAVDADIPASTTVRTLHLRGLIDEYV